jgi:hypothetical protein
MTRRACGAAGQRLFLVGALVFFWLFSLAGFDARAQTTGPVAAYAFNEGAGTTLGDASGNGNTGTLQGPTWTAAGKYGAALSFDGINDLVVVNPSNSLNLSTAMTLEAWVFPTAAQSGWRTIVQREVDAFTFNASNINGALHPAGGGTFDGQLDHTASPSALAVNAWSHVALTWDGATLRLYVNGAQVSSKPRTGTLQTSANGAGPIRIGGNVPYGEFFQGLIDELRIYNRALSAAEVESDMNAPVASTAPAVPTVSLAANPTSVASGGSSTLTWSSTDATSCTASGGWSGTKATSGSQSTGTLTASGNFTLTCTGAGGSASASATVTVTAAPPAPTASLTANPTSVPSGGSSTLTWSTTDASSCTASGGWSGTKATSGSQSTGALTASTDFLLTCTGAGGSASVSARVTVTGGTPVPTVSLTANPTSVASGGASTLTWSSTNATSCTASGDWSGTKATSGSQSTGALTASGNFTLTCTGAGGSASASATVTLTGPSFGLEFPGNGAVRRMLFWNNPFPIYDATYVFRVFPRKKTVPSNSPTGYYTTFFWGNNGTFIWDNGNGNTYYGAHPYPIPAPNGPGQWEISVNSNDYVTGSEVVWDRWYTQAFRAWRESPSVTHHEFYWDLPDTSKVITQTVVDPHWAAVNPPSPAIVMGQAPNLNGASWGTYPGWEEFNGIIRGIQLYSGLLSLADIQAEIANPMSTTAGKNLIWYLNVNPRPSDVTDKKGVGTPHNPAWDGTTALEWTE